MTATPISITFGGFPVVRAEDVAARVANGQLQMRTIGRKLPLELANSYHCPLGKEIGRGWLFMLRDDVRKLSASTYYDLQFRSDRTRVSFPTLYFVRSYRVTTGNSADPDSLHLVEIADKRWQASKSSIQKSYNIRPIYSSDHDYIASTLRDDDPEDPYTWREIAESIWNQVGSGLLGVWANSLWPGGGSYVPDGTPENIQYHGCSAWEALNDFVSRVGCAVRYNPLTDAFSIIQLGVGLTSQAGETTMLVASGMTANTDNYPQLNTFRNFADRLMEDEESHKSSTELPAVIDVYFPANYAECGEEAKTTPFFKVSVTAAQANTELANPRYSFALAATAADTKMAVRDAMHALFDSDDTDTPTNESELEERALAIAADWYGIQIDMASGRLVQSGIWDHIPGPFISEVRYRAMLDGMKTEIIREPVEYLPWMDMTVKDCSSGGGAEICSFRILSTSCGVCQATAEVVNRPVGVSRVTGENDYGEILIFDFGQCFLDAPEDDLIGRRGMAVYLDVLEECAVDPGITAGWHIISLCCLEDAC